MRIVIGLVVRDSFPGLKKNCLDIAMQISEDALRTHLGDENAKIWIKHLDLIKTYIGSCDIEDIEEGISSYVQSNNTEDLTQDIIKDFLKYFGGYYLNSDQGGFDFNPDDFNDSYEETFVTFLK